jgi:mono/diheme cytochrome c family protein
MRTMSLKWIVMCAVTALAAACARSTPAPSAPPATAEDQVARGQKEYTEHCAKCHGAAGEGVADKGPPVVGPSALPAEPRPGQKRKATVRTALDVAQFVKKAMPGDDPGSLSDDDYFAILAFDLKANGIDLGGKTLDAAGAEKIVLH